MFSALAAGSCSAGSRRGITALRVGWFTARNAVCTANRQSTSQTPPTPVAAVTQSTSDMAAIPAPVSRSSTRRSTASAIAPPHRPKNTSGTSPKMPVRPTYADEPVSR